MKRRIGKRQIFGQSSRDEKRGRRPAPIIAPAAAAPTIVAQDGMPAATGARPMRAASIDDLAKDLSAAAGSRRGALRLVGGALAATLATTFFPQFADAGKKAKRRCRKKGGVPVSQGECRCALTCATVADADFSCNGDITCFCGKSVEGDGFCAVQGAVDSACSATSECPTGATCVRIPDCPESGGRCDTAADCPAADVCLDGHCERTFCFLPCPTTA
jgi:hypothetical protein